jgi:hypothetical protein
MEEWCRSGDSGQGHSVHCPLTGEGRKGRVLIFCLPNERQRAVPAAGMEPNHDLSRRVGPGTFYLVGTQGGLSYNHMYRLV